MSTLEATQQVPMLVEQIQDGVTSADYSGARNNALRALHAWIERVGPALREGGQVQLADDFENRDGEELGTKDGIRAAYDKRVALLTPLPDLEIAP